MKEHVISVVGELTPEHERVIFKMDTFFGRGPKYVADALQLSLTRARILLRDLARHGVCAFGPLISEEDGLMRGRGYWLDRFGQAVRDQLELRWLRRRAAADIPMTESDCARLVELEGKEHCT